MADDLYEGDESSGLLAHFIGRVKDSLWSSVFAESQGQRSEDWAHDTQLFWHVDVLDILQANYEVSGTPIESLLVSFGIGKHWGPDPANPNLVTHDDDSGSSLKKFHVSTNFMRFVQIVSGKETDYPNAIVLDGDGDLGAVDLSGVRAQHAANGVTTLRDATIWNGFIFEFRGIGFKTRNNEPRMRPFPVHYLGYDLSETPKLPEGSKIDSPTNLAGRSNGALGTVTPEATAAWSEAGADEATVKLLTKLWGNADDAADFIANAALLPAVKGNDALAAAVANTVGS